MNNAQRNLEIYQQQYQQGLANFLELLNAQTQIFDLQDQVSELRFQELSNRITLGLALGLGTAS